MRSSIISFSNHQIIAPLCGVKRFPNAGYRSTNGATTTVGTGGGYWSSDQISATVAYRLTLYSGYPAGGLGNTDKLYAFSVRCVRL